LISKATCGRQTQGREKSCILLSLPGHFCTTRSQIKVRRDEPVERSKKKRGKGRRRKTERREERNVMKKSGDDAR